MFRTVAVSGAMLALAGCAAPTAEPSLGLAVGSASVTFGENASFGLLRASQDPGLVSAFERELLAELQTDVVTIGSNSAEVVVEQITIQSGAGRIVAGAESFVSGDVIIRDATGAIVGRVDDVSFTNTASTNQATFNGIPIGALISAASNASDASPEAQITTLADGFAGVIATRIGR